MLESLRIVVCNERNVELSSQDFVEKCLFDSVANKDDLLVFVV